MYITPCAFVHVPLSNQSVGSISNQGQQTMLRIQEAESLGGTVAPAQCQGGTSTDDMETCNKEHGKSLTKLCSCISQTGQLPAASQAAKPMRLVSKSASQPEA